MSDPKPSRLQREVMHSDAPVHDVWLAGLGALSLAQDDPDAFQALVERGRLASGEASPEAEPPPANRMTIEQTIPASTSNTAESSATGRRFVSPDDTGSLSADDIDRMLETVHILENGDQWIVRTISGERITRTFDTKQEAIRFAESLSEDDPLIHCEDGPVCPPPYMS